MLSTEEFSRSIEVIAEIPKRADERKRDLGEKILLIGEMIVSTSQLPRSSLAVINALHPNIAEIIRVQQSGGGSITRSNTELLIKWE